MTVKLGEIKEMSFKDMDLPETLYKYRVWDNEYQKTIVSKRTVFMAAPTSFEDEKDCKLLKRYDLMTEGDIYNKYLENSKEENPNWSRQQHRKFARDWTKKSPMKNIEHIKKLQEENFNEYDKRFGVLSLTANSKNLTMWNKYSNEGRGFCVGFDPLILFEYLGGGGPVKYYDELPDIYHNDQYEIERYKQVFSKEKKWEFEQEYRTHKFYQNPASISDRQIEIPPEAYKEMIFGWKMEKDIIDDIIKICVHLKLNLGYFKAKIVENEVLLEKIQPD
ncbi:MAG: DUF2971 domain-containing protein [Fulvivirga sp.]